MDIEISDKSNFERIFSIDFNAFVFLVCLVLNVFNNNVSVCAVYLLHAMTQHTIFVIL